MGSTISTSGILLPALEPLAAILATGSREPRGSGPGTGVTMMESSSMTPYADRRLQVNGGAKHLPDPSSVGPTKHVSKQTPIWRDKLLTSVNQIGVDSAQFTFRVIGEFKKYFHSCYVGIYAAVQMP